MSMTKEKKNPYEEIFELFFRFGRVNDFAFLNNNNLIIILDKKHQLWMQQWPSEKGFYEIICKDEYSVSQNRYLFSVNSELLCYTDCAEQIRIFSNALAGKNEIELVMFFFSSNHI